MHELSIAKNIVEIIKESVEENDLRSIERVVLKVGELSGVVPDSLQFSLEAISTGTELESAKYEMKRIPFTIKCKVCGNVSDNELGIVKCPVCGSKDTEVVSGNELLISEIILKN
ncbi:MAG: hydrogenase maturation nickel metallochaperone HypA [Bacteroidetes bacterium]|nr:hydrogenase maturation nickel metallochaperone HypA [Bacteroidota bacterium]